MFISDFAIRKPVVTVTAVVALVVFGLIALMKLETDEFPDIQAPFISVTIPYPGASPDVVEREVIEPIEEAVYAISGIVGRKSMSTASDGLAQMLLEFEFDKGVEQAAQDVRDAISSVRNKLPLEMEEPIITRFDPSLEPIMQLTLSSTSLPATTLTRLADPVVTRELRAVPGVAQVNVVGGIEREMTVELRPAAMQSAGVSVGQIVGALQAQNLAAPVGRLNGALEEKSIRLRGRLEGPEDFANVVVAERGGALIRLRDVATVRDGTEEPRTMAIFNGKEAVGISVLKAKGYSTTAVSQQIRERLDLLQDRLPAAARLEVVQDAGERVAQAVTNVQKALIEGAALTVLVVFIFLNSWRSTVITGLALPVSVLASFIAVWAFGFTLNTMSLLGLSLSIGILIDDAIVVRENIVRHIEMGMDHYEASRVGTSQIGLAVTATTFSIVAVFVPIGFMEGLSGQWFKPFALTIACAVLVSLFVSFSLDPMLSAYWADPQTEQHERRNVIARALDRFNNWFNRQAENYKKLIAWALDHRMAMVMLAVASFFAALAIPAVGILGALVVLAAVVVAFRIWALPFHWFRTLPHVAFGGPLQRTFAPDPFRRSSLRRFARITAVFLEWLIAVVLKVGAGLAAAGLVMKLVKFVPVVGQVGGGFVPVSDRSEVTMIVETPPGSNLEYTRLKSEEAARLVREHPEVQYTYTTIGGYIPLRTPGVDQAQIYVRLVPKADRSISQEEIGHKLRTEMKQIGGADIAVFTSGFGGAFKQIQLQFRGPDAAVLTRIAKGVADTLRTIPGAVDVGLSTRGEKPELEVQIERGLAGTLGISVGQVAQSLRPAFAGIDAGDWVDPGGETRDVVVRLAPDARRRTADLQQLPLMVPGGPGGTQVTVPLGQIATVRQSVGPAQIDHLNRDKVVTVQANTTGRSLNEVLTALDEKLARMPLPPGYVRTQGGEAADQQEVFTNMLIAMATAVMLMYLILVMQFGSFLDPLAIMVSLPLSLIGVVLALLITNDTLNIMSMIGVILLMGIVAKNAILLIDFAKWGRERGLPLREAIIEAGAIRLRPIMMTTVALIAGMIPVAIGSGEGADFRAPLGRAVIGGTITATLLTLLVIPTIYEILDEFREKAVGMLGWERFKTQEHHVVPSPQPEPAGD